jgi:hypothetical protein
VLVPKPPEEDDDPDDEEAPKELDPDDAKGDFVLELFVLDAEVVVEALLLLELVAGGAQF